MPLSREEWHHRFSVQAQWTEALRLYFFDLIKDDDISSILDIGCGTGALLPDLQYLSPAQIYGADLDLGHLDHAKAICPDCSLSGADVHHLPFSDNSFDVVLCHYLLMWVGDPQHALQEMHRVSRPGGSVVAFAEPDYGGRIDHPSEFLPIREYQITSLLNAGADPRMGRKLQSLFNTPAFSNVESGVYQGFWKGVPSPAEVLSEWKMLADDLNGLLDAQQLEDLGRADQLARESGTRLIYVPTFYAWGKVVKFD